MEKVKCILLVDDDDVSNFINKRTLSKFNICDTVVIAKNGKEALDYFNIIVIENGENPPGLVFLDLNMPVMNGFEFLKNYNNLTFNNKDQVKVVVLTTSSAEKDIERLKEMGIKYYITKPLNPEKIKEVV